MGTLSVEKQEKLEQDAVKAEKKAEKKAEQEQKKKDVRSNDFRSNCATCDSERHMKFCS
jgi:hypothetical protein